VAPLLDIASRDEFDALVIRTDYSDEQVWQDVRSELAMPWGGGEFMAKVHVVDDPAWAGTSADGIRAALPSDSGVVFLADRATMEADHHALLAVATFTREDFDNDEDYETAAEFGREFRTSPRGVSEIHTNLYIANMDFYEFAESADHDSERVHRSF
jgi:hypothetical protein